MPTQLKIVAVDGFNQDAPFTVNFASPIIIKPGQKITLDKFTAVVNGITTGFFIEDNTSFDMYLSVNALTNQYKTVAITPGQYQTVSELLNFLTYNANDAISAYVDDNFPDLAPLIRYYRDRGLKVVCGTNNNAFQFQFLTVAPTTTTLVPTGMSTSTGTPPYLFPSSGTGVRPFTVKPPTTFPFLLAGGGVSVEFQFYPSSVINALTNTLDYKVGFVDSFGTYHGLCQNALTSNRLALINESATAGTQYTIISEDPFQYFPNDPTVFCQLYLLNGFIQIRSFKRLGGVGSEEITYFNSSASADTREKLGRYDYTQNYSFQMMGSSASTVFSKTPALANRISATCDLGFSTGGASPPSTGVGGIPTSPPTNGSVYTRTMALDFGNAGALRAGFGVPLGQILLTPNNSWWGAYFQTAAINMSVVQSTFDLALEILDIPLQSYVAKSDGRPGSRTNVLCYFHPELSSIGTGIYVYTASSYQWLDIDISYPLNLSSLSCRVYNPDNGLPLDAQSMSFNLMINDSVY